MMREDWWVLRALLGLPSAGEGCGAQIGCIGLVVGLLWLLGGILDGLR